MYYINARAHIDSAMASSHEVHDSSGRERQAPFVFRKWLLQRRTRRSSVTAGVSPPSAGRADDFIVDHEGPVPLQPAVCVALHHDVAVRLQTLVLKLWRQWRDVSSTRSLVSSTFAETRLQQKLVMRSRRDPPEPAAEVGDVIVWREEGDEYDDLQVTVTVEVGPGRHDNRHQVKVGGRLVGQVYCTPPEWTGSQYLYMPGIPRTAVHFRRLAWVARQSVRCHPHVKRSFVEDLKRLHLVQHIIDHHSRRGDEGFYMIRTHVPCDTLSDSSDSYVTAAGGMI